MPGVACGLAKVALSSCFAPISGFGDGGLACALTSAGFAASACWPLSGRMQMLQSFLTGNLLALSVKTELVRMHLVICELLSLSV